MRGGTPYQDSARSTQLSLHRMWAASPMRATCETTSKTNNHAVTTLVHLADPRALWTHLSGWTLQAAHNN